MSLGEDGPYGIIGGPNGGVVSTTADGSAVHNVYARTILTPERMLSSVFLTAVLPIVSLATIGYVPGRSRDVGVGARDTVAIYGLAPSV